MAKKKRLSNISSNGNGNGNGKPDTLPTKPTGAAVSLDAIESSKRVQSTKKSLPPERKALNLPFEIERGDWTVVVLALMMFLAPSIGVPNEMMLQDTLKSIVVSFAAVGAGLLFFWHQRNRRDGLRWHAIMWLPLALMFYALGSMVWSHTF